MAEHERSTRLRTRLALLSAGLLALAGCGGSSTGKSTTTTQSSAPAPSTSSAAKPTPQPAVPTAPIGSRVVTASAGGVTATMHAGIHRPKVERPWTIRFTVTRGGHPVRASVSYEYLFGGQVVAHRSHYTFTGRFSDVF
ncbi:MAG TPA: hypothetical protein VEW68_03840, partial [Patescibacteria group bacterium]|nr:hypothetical protein [Patescibacteria group bacterium]